MAMPNLEMAATYYRESFENALWLLIFLALSLMSLILLIWHPMLSRYVRCSRARTARRHRPARIMRRDIINDYLDLFIDGIQDQEISKRLGLSEDDLRLYRYLLMTYDEKTGIMTSTLIKEARSRRRRRRRTS